MLKTIRGKVWLTETGGIVKLGKTSRTARAARPRRWAACSRWPSPTSASRGSTSTSSLGAEPDEALFDAGLINPDNSASARATTWSRSARRAAATSRTLRRQCPRSAATAVSRPPAPSARARRAQGQRGRAAPGDPRPARVVFRGAAVRAQRRRPEGPPVARAADDGYEHELLPGLRSSVDAGRLADEIAFSAARLDELSADPPGLYAEVARADGRRGGHVAGLPHRLPRRRWRARTRGRRSSWRAPAGRPASCRRSRTSRSARAPRTTRRAARRRCSPTAPGPSAPARRRRPSRAIRRGPTSAASTARSSGCRCRASAAPRASICS